MTFDEGLPFFCCPTADQQVCVVEGRLVGRFVEISMYRARRLERRRGAEEYMPLELMALKRFPSGQLAAYSTYAGHLEDAARTAARGELGYTVHTEAADGAVKISLVARLLAEDGHMQTDISHEHTFVDPDSELALIRANEKAAELRALADELNDQWNSLRAARLESLRAEYDDVDARAEAAQQLQRIVDAEAD